MRQSKSIPRRREKPRRKRPWLFPKPKPDPWPAISRAVRKEWWETYGPGILCGICGLKIHCFDDLSPDHVVPGKMGGCKDHSRKNLQPSHYWCNLKKGSQRNYTAEQALLLTQGQAREKDKPQLGTKEESA